MKIKDFDDAIRDKLDEVNQVYDKQKADKVFRHVRSNMHIPFVKRYRSAILYTISITTFIILITLITKQFYDNNLLYKKNETLQNQLQSNKLTNTNNTDNNNNKSTKMADSSIIVSTKETRNEQQKAIESLNNDVYKTKTTEFSKKTRSAFDPYEEKNNSVAKKSTLNRSNRNDSSYRPSINGEKTPRNNSTAQLPIKDIHNTRSVSQNQKNDSMVKPNSPTKDVSLPYAVTSTVKENVLKEDNAINSDGKSNTKNGSNQLLDSTDKENAKSQSIVNNIEPTFKNPVTDTTKESPNNKFAIKNLRFRGGVEFLFANSQVGFGLSSEILFNHNWGLSTGLRLLNIENKPYKNDNEFYKHKEIHFNFDTTANNIGIHTLLLQVPVSFTYQLPLKNKFALIASAGTDIDLFGSGEIVYLPNGSGNELQKIKMNYPIVNFNNITFSVGVQKHWKKMIFQVSPFISRQLRPVIYKKDNLFGGVKFNILFSNE